jgi:hypothetical protein
LGGESTGCVSVVDDFFEPILALEGRLLADF